MNNTIFFLFGNRDLQITKDYLGESLNNQAVSIIEKFFVPQNDGDDLTVNKSKGGGFSFLEASEIVYKQNDLLKEVLTFPMVEGTLAELNLEKPKLIFCSSKQEKPHYQDSFYFAQTAAVYYKNLGFETDVELFSCNPNDFEGLVTFFSNTFDLLAKEGTQLVISNSGGTPNMRAASHFSGVFKGFQYVNIDSFTKKANVQSFKAQEQLILKGIVANMLEVYDYEGINKLPVRDEVKILCEESLGLYNLKTDYVDQHQRYYNRAIAAIELLYNNLIVCEKQGRYADVIGRIFRLEEALWQLLFYLLLKDTGAINDQDKVKRIDSKGKEKYDKTFEKIDSQGMLKNAILLQEFPDLIFEKEVNGRLGYYFTQYPEVPTFIGKSLYFYIFQSLGINKNICDFFRKINNDYQLENPLGELRNKSILGHGFRGVAREDIEDITGDIYKLFVDLKQIIEDQLGISIPLIFDQQNKLIEDQL